MPHPSGKTFQEQLTDSFRKASKAKNFEAMAYYQEKARNPNLVACASFERYKGTLAYVEWKKKPETQAMIDTLVKESKRFFYRD